jgi:hypothetical protein
MFPRPPGAHTAQHFTEQLVCHGMGDTDGKHSWCIGLSVYTLRLQSLIRMMIIVIMRTARLLIHQVVYICIMDVNTTRMFWVYLWKRVLERAIVGHNSRK